MGHVDKKAIESELRFKAAMADLIIAWNQLEHAAKYLLERMARADGIAGQILTARIEGVQLCDALAALASGHDGDIEEHVAHLITGFDILRIWRNYVVHGIVGVTGEQGECVGFANEIKVSRGLKFRRNVVVIETLQKVRKAIGEYHRYASSIIGRVSDHTGLLAHA